MQQKINIPSLGETLPDVTGKRVLVRVDWNVPLESGRESDSVRDDFRITATLPTIEWLRARGARIILLSHLGRHGETLLPVAQHAQTYIPDLLFVPDIVGQDAQSAVNKLSPGEVLLLENIRTDVREEEGSEAFAKELASLADIYVQDAFGVLHREHTSITFLPKLLPSYAGFVLMREIEKLSLALNAQEGLFTILSGAKFETKLPLIGQFQKKGGPLFVGGALANTLLRAKGLETGRSLSEDPTDTVKELAYKENILLPIDVLVVDDAGTRVIPVHEVSKDMRIVDIGPETIAMLSSHIESASTILMNGPLGLYEEGFSKGTERILETIDKASARSVVGGGDTVPLAQKIIQSPNVFISTGGGATIDFLSQGTLPGIEAIKR